MNDKYSKNFGFDQNAVLLPLTSSTARIYRMKLALSIHNELNNPKTD